MFIDYSVVSGYCYEEYSNYSDYEKDDDEEEFRTAELSSGRTAEIITEHTWL